MAQLEGSKTHNAKEVFYIDEDDPDYPASLPMAAPNQWPDADAPYLKRDLLPYYRQVLELSRKILGALAVGLGKEKEFFEMTYQKPLGRG